MRNILCTSLVLLAAPAIYAQKIVPDKVESAKPGQAIVLELVGDVAKDDVVSWVTRVGKGTIRILDSEQKKVEFVPVGPADSILVVCIIVPPHGSRKEAIAQIKLQPGGSTPESGPPPVNVAPAPAPVKPPPVVQTPAHAGQHVADGYIDQLGFIPAGFMGSAQEGATVDLNQGFTIDPHSEPTCIRLAYTPEAAQTGSQQSKVPWFAIGWQFTSGEPNFGDAPGRDLDAGVAESARYRSLRIWAKGDLKAGQPPIVQFKSGGGTKPGLAEGLRASYEVVDQFRPLTSRWAEYCLDLTGKKLTNVVSAFTIVMERAGNSNGAVVYLDDIHFSPEACPARGR